MTPTASTAPIPLTILDAMRDPELFGSVLSGASWAPWMQCAAAVFGTTTGLTRADRQFIRRCLGRARVPKSPAQEAWLVIGRRGGKSRFAALVAIFLACFRDYTRVLAPGERGVLMIIAADRRQAQVVKRYISALLQAVPMLAALVERETKESLVLTTGVTIEIHTASFRAIRGYTCVGAICDEIAFWRTDDSANPDTEILNALRPAMATVPGALLLGISSPYARRGELYRAYRDHFGQDDDSVLVWQADTRTMNPTVPNRIIDQAYAEDEAVASVEYVAIFRTDVESFVSREAIDAATIPGRLELPPISSQSHVGFVDPSGGSQDGMTLAIAHREDDRAVLDVVREVTPPFSPGSVVEEFAALLKTYHVTRVRGDRYGGEWPREQFRTHDVEYEVCDSPKSALYGELLPALNSGRVELLDLTRLRAQLAGLERRTTRSGKDSIDHAPGGHDDVINAAAGALVFVLSRSSCMSADSLENFIQSLQGGQRRSKWQIGDSWL